MSVVALNEAAPIRTSRFHNDFPPSSATRNTRCSSTCAMPCFPLRVVDGAGVDDHDDARDRRDVVLLDDDLEAARQRELLDWEARARWAARPRSRRWRQASAASAKTIRRGRPVTRGDVYLIDSSSMSKTSMPVGAPGRGELS